MFRSAFPCGTRLLHMEGQLLRDQACLFLVTLALLTGCCTSATPKMALGAKDMVEFQQRGHDFAPTGSYAKMEQTQRSATPQWANSIGL